MGEIISTLRNRALDLEDLITIVWGLTLITLLFPYRPINSWSFLLLLVLSAIFFFTRRKENKLRFVAFHIYYIIPFLLHLLSLLFISEANIKVMEKEAGTICFPAITFLLLNANFRFSRKSYHLLLICFLLSVLGVLLYTYVRSFFYSEEFFAHYFLTFDIIHPTYFSFYCGVSILIILELCKGRGAKINWIAYFVIVCILLYMTLLSSRMPVIATIFLLLLSLFFSGLGIKKKLVAIVASCVLLATMTFIIYNSPRLNYRFIEAVKKNFNTRLVSWEASTDVFKDHPFFGVGTGADQSYLDNLYKIKLKEPGSYISLNSHNYYLHILMTFGIVGFLLTSLFWYKLISLSLHYRSQLLTRSLTLFLLCSITEVMLDTQKGIVFLYLFYSLHLMFVIERTDNATGKQDILAIVNSKIIK